MVATLSAPLSAPTASLTPLVLPALPESAESALSLEPSAESARLQALYDIAILLLPRSLLSSCPPCPSPLSSLLSPRNLSAGSARLQALYDIGGRSQAARQPGVRRGAHEVVAAEGQASGALSAIAETLQPREVARHVLGS